MTLQELFQYLSEQPNLVLGYFTIIPILALVAGVLDKDEGHYQPWNYIYAALIYLVSIPGIFVITLNVYLWLFEGKGIMTFDLITQVLPIVSMIITLLIIRRNVILDYIPGFDRLSGLIVIITAIICLMWVIDRTRIVAFARIRFEYIFLIIIGLLFLIRFGLKRFSGSQH